MREETITCADRTITLLIPDAPNGTALYLIGEGEELTAAEAAARGGAAVAAIPCRDWNAELSPWPAARAFKRGEDFSGGGPRFLHLLTEEIVPAVEGALDWKAGARGIAGYSLAGLFALWAAWETPLFSRAASMSGSLWFDGFRGYIEGRDPVGGLETCYLSLGDLEAKSRNPRLAEVETCTRAVYQRLTVLGAKAVFELNEGNHFQRVPERIEKGLLFLIPEEARAHVL